MPRDSAKMRVMNSAMRLQASAHERLNVTERALVQRINRMLRRRYDYLHKLMKSRGREYYLLSRHKDSVEKRSMDLESYARELGALRPFERLEGDGRR
jgi:hypothetical protein